MKQMSINEALSKIRGMAGSNGKIIEEPCPKCGGPVVCAYRDMGLVDFYDNFAHVCLNPDCDFMLHEEIYEGNLGGGRNCPATNECIFCHREIWMSG